MIRFEQVAKHYRRRGSMITALQPTSLAVAPGEYVAVVGPSGSGKSTLLSVLGGMLAPSEGRVWFEGHSLYQLSVAERTKLRGARIGFVFQTFNLIGYLSALENVQVPLYLAGLAPAAQRERARELLDRVGLGDRVAHKPGELSVGQQQRVALARTLANDPALILADEPTGNLDPATRDQVLGLLDEFHGQGRTIVLVTHDRSVAERAGRRLHLLSGDVTTIGTPAVLPRVA